MNGNSQESQPNYPNPPPPSSTSASPQNSQESKPDPQPGPSSPGSSNPPTPPNNDVVTAEKWGTRVMGTPAVPTVHPNNQKAALWGAGDQSEYHHYPYVQYTPIQKPAGNPLETVLQKFNSWSSIAETTANNIWHNLKTGPSVTESAWGKMNLTAKALTGGGFESIYKQTFSTHPNEMLKKSFACYLSTATGPVAGTLYLSNLHVAFCSDRPLSFTAPSGQQTWSYYKVMVPLGKISTINPVLMRENQSERYIQIVTVDGHDFWFMGFVNYEKASHYLFEGISSFAATGIPVHTVAD